MKSVIAIILLLLLLLIFEYPNIVLPLLTIIGIILFFTVRRTMNKLEREEQVISRAINETTKKYKETKSKIDIPVETRIVHYSGGDARILEGNLQIWLRDGVLHLFPFIPVIDRPIDMENKVYLLKISLKDIECYFMEEGKGRHTILKYYNKGQIHSMAFSNRDYRIFKEIIPDKDYHFSKSGGKIIELASNDR